ncbi:MAG: HEAT repeat domain-containing protein [Methanomicrobiaceae archaeon]|nr:HEAT repeat domain-containing protein [Methanomicrobiaceae archaeon]
MAFFGRSAPDIRKLKAAGDSNGLLNILAGADTEYYPEAAMALFSLGAPAIKAVVARLSGGSGSSGIAHALSSPGLPAIPALMHVVPKVPPEVAVIISDDVARLGTAAFETLTPALMHESPSVRKGAAIILGSMGKKNMDALLALRHLSRDSHRDVRREAGNALVRTGWEPEDDTEKAYLFCIREEWKECVKLKKAAVPVLLEAAGDPDPTVRIPAIRSLGRIHDIRAIPILKQGLSDEDAHVRAAAAESFGELGDKHALSNLVAVLVDSYPQVRMEAAWALDRLGWKPATARQQIQYLIAKEQWNELANLGKPAIQPLIEVLQEAHSGVRLGAVEALRKIGKPAHEALQAALSVQDAGRKDSARRAISSIQKKNEEESSLARRSDADPGTFRREYDDGMSARKKFDERRVAEGRLPVRPGRATEEVRPPVPKQVLSPEEERDLRQRIAESERKVTEGLAAVERRRQSAKQPEPAAKPAAGAEPTVEDIHRMETFLQERFSAIEREEMAAARVRARAALEDADDLWGTPAAPHAEGPSDLIDYDSHTSITFTSEEIAVKEDPGEVLLRALRSRDEAIRATAIESLRDMGDQAIEYLIGALQDEKYTVRLAASDALGEIGSQKGVGPLIQVLRDPHEDVRISAAFSLGSLKNPLSLSFLVGLFDDEYNGVRFAAADAVVEFGDAALTPLVQALENPNALVRITAGRGLAKLADIRSIPALIEHLGDEVGEVRWGVSQALSGIGAPAIMPLTWVLKKGLLKERLAALDALGTIYDDRAQEAILIAMQDPDEEVREKASHVMKKREILNVWREAWLKRVESEEEQPQLIGAMQENDAKEFDKDGTQEIDNLIIALKERNGTSQVAVSMRLMMMGRPAVEGLIRALRNEDADIKKAAAEVLGEMREVAVDPLMNALRDDNTFVRTVAARNLGKIGNERSIDALVNAMHTERNYRVRAVIAEALGYMGNRSSIEPLIIALRDRDEEVQMAAAHSLGYIGDRRAIEPLIQALNDVDYRVRHVALEALRDPSGIPQEHLVNALKYGEKEFKQGVAEALDQLGWEAKNDTEYAYYLIGKDRWGELDRLGMAAIGPVTEALSDETVDVRLIAMKTMSRIGGAPVVTPLIGTLGDTAPAVRMGAERALIEIGEPAMAMLRAAASMDEKRAPVIDRIVKAIEKRSTSATRA